MSKQEKTQAELYREQRKARLAKAAKKNAKKSISSQAGKTAGKVVSVILVVAIVFGIGSVIFKQGGVIEKTRTAFTIADEKVSQAEYGYYYMGIYNNAYSYAQQYAQYGMNVGLDTTKSPATQEYSGFLGEIEDFPEDETPMWTDYFEHASIENIKYIKGACKEAEKLGLELTDADKAEVESTMQQYRDYANSAGGENSTYSLSAWLKQNYGKGMTEKLFEKILLEQQLASLLQKTKTDEYKASYSEKQVNKEYNKNAADYGVITIRNYAVAAEKVTTTDEDGNESSAVTKATMQAAKAAADKIAAASTEEAFKTLAAEAAKASGNKEYKTILTDDTATLSKDISYQAASQSIGDEDFLEWAFDANTAIGTSYIVENEDSGYDVYMMVDPLHKAAAYDTYDSRHILINFKQEETADTKADEDAKAADETEETTAAETETTAKVKEEVKVETLDTSKYSDVKIDLAVNAETAKDKAAYKEAQDILEKYLKGDHTAEAFGELANEYSADTGSNQKGGLYEGTTVGNFVPPYEEWCLADGRKEGDVGIVEYEGSNYSGYHILYFVGRNTVTWDDAVRSALAQEELNEYVESIVHNEDYAVQNENDKAIAAVEKYLVDAVKTSARNSSSSHDDHDH